MCGHRSPNNPIADHNKMMDGPRKENYFDNYNKVNRSAVEKAFKRRERMVPWDLLK